MIGFYESGIFWSEKGNGNVESLLHFLQSLFNKMATIMKSIALAAYRAHVVFLNVLGAK